MRYDNLSAFEKHLKEVSPKRFSPLYLILGKEAFECQEAVKLFLHFALPSPHDRELALTIVDGAQVDESYLEVSLFTRSFFSDLRVIWIQQAEKLKKSVQDKLEKYLIHPIYSQYFILSASGWQKNTIFYKTIEKEGSVLELAEVKPWEKEKRLAEWVNKQVISLRKLISYPVCQFLVKQVGNDQATLVQELEKLICYTEGKKEITQQDVEAICTCQQGESIWSLGEAIFQRDKARAMHIAHGLLMDGALLPLLRQIRSQLQVDYQVCQFLVQGKQPQEIAQEFPYMKGQILDKHLKQAQQYGLNAFKTGLLAIDATEMQVKNSFANEKILLELLMVHLTQ